MAISTVSQAAAARVHPQRSLQLALAAARTAEENRGQQVVVLDMREQTPIFDYFVIVTGASRRQLRAISSEVDNTLEKALGDHRMTIAGYEESRWIVLDYGTVVIHIFDEEARAYYDLEGLWAGAKVVEWNAEDAGVRLAK